MEQYSTHSSENLQKNINKSFQPQDTKKPEQQMSYEDRILKLLNQNPQDKTFKVNSLCSEKP
jgi:hypothetical protein